MNKSPQSTQRSLGFTIPATTYETAPSSGRGTRMTRIFTDLRASMRSEFHYFIHALSGSGSHFLEKIQLEEKPQRTQRKIQRSVFSECWYEEINNELGLLEFVSFRISSLFSRYLFSCSVKNQNIWRNL
jgi:hypothetical protein